MIVTIFHRDWMSQVLAKVAQVKVEQTDDHEGCEAAWRATQNILGSWSRGEFLHDGAPNPDCNPAVTVLAPLPSSEGVTYGLRSSDLSDVFCVDGERWFAVDGVGFKAAEPVYLVSVFKDGYASDNKASLYTQLAQGPDLDAEIRRRFGSFARVFHHGPAVYHPQPVDPDRLRQAREISAKDNS